MGDDPEIAAMASLRTAYEQNDIGTIDKLLTSPSYKILSDVFIKVYLQDLLRSIRLQVLQNIIRPYKCIGIEFLAKELNVHKDEVVSLLVQLILDEKVSARIDDTNGFLWVNSGSTHQSKKSAA